MNKAVEVKANFEQYKKLFLEINKDLNLISKNDEKYLYEKHICDSLGIKLFFEQYNFIPETLLDIGTGGGFPALPIAIEYPNISVTGIDGTHKKIEAISRIAEELGLKNAKFINIRAEDLKGCLFDVVTSRALGRLEKLIKYSHPRLKKGGYLVFYKSKTAEKELAEVGCLIKKLKLKICSSVRYELPLEENYDRVLVVLRK